MKAVLIGATGATGKELLQLLLEDNTITRVVALVRKPLGIQHEKLQTALINFDNPESWQHLVNADVAFSCLGTTLKAAGSKEAQYKVDYSYQFEFAKAAQQNGVPKFILISAAMAHPKSLVFYSRIKGELEQAIQALHFDNFVVFKPGFLLRPSTDRRGEKITGSALRWLGRIGLFKQLAPLPVKKLARLMLDYAGQNGQGMQVVESAKILNETKYL